MSWSSMIATVGDGSVTASSLSNSSAIRSRDKAMRSFARAAQAASASGIGRTRSKTRVEAEEAQDAQVVLGNPFQRLADEAHAPGEQVVRAAEIIVDLARPRIGRQGIDGEIAARRVFLPIVGEGDRRPPAVGCNVPPQAGHFDRMAAADGSDRAMIDARRNGADLRGLQPLDDLLRAKPGRQIDVAEGKVQQIVADRAADIAGQSFVGSKRVEHTGHAAPLAPFLGVDLQLHWSLRDRLTIIAAVAPQILRSFHTIS